MANDLFFGIQTNGIKHTHADPMPDIDTRFRMVRDAGVFDYVDKTPDADQIDDFKQASDTYGIPVRAGGWFYTLGEDEALLIECEKPDAQYFGFTLHTLGWLESGDFADRQTSLSDQQIFVDRDGRIRVVLSQSDPGVPNWIDITARPRGLLVYRWVWAATNPLPESKVVPLAALREALPVDHPEVDTDARRRTLSLRREDAWNRFT